MLFQGFSSVVEVHLKTTYAVKLFEKITNSQVLVRLPTKAPTAAPTSNPTNHVGPEFTNDSLKAAVNEWTSNKPDALEKHGDTKCWGTSKGT